MNRNNCVYYGLWKFDSLRDNIPYRLYPTCGKSKIVFIDLSGKPLNPDNVREVIWKPALKKAGIKYRALMQTHHTFATIALSEGEDIGWVQHMLGHGSLQMIYTKYYAWIPRETRNDGSAMMRAYKSVFYKRKERPISAPNPFRA